MIYRFRQPAWLWAVLATLFSSLVAIVIFTLGLTISVSLPDFDLESAIQLWRGGLVMAVIFAQPIVVWIAVVTALVLGAVGSRESRTAGVLLSGYEWIIWLAVLSAPFVYPWISWIMGIGRIPTGAFDIEFGFLIWVVVASLICAGLARPFFLAVIYYRVS